MPNINDVFQSGEYLKAADLQGKNVNLTVSHVDFKEVEQGKTKPIVHFNGTDKKLVCNKTNAMLIAEMHGPETEGWAGKQITLYPTKVDFQGKLVDAIRVQASFAPVNGPAPDHPNAPNNGGSVGGDPNDPIPFGPETR